MKDCSITDNDDLLDIYKNREAIILYDIENSKKYVITFNELFSGITNPDFEDLNETTKSKSLVSDPLESNISKVFKDFDSERDHIFAGSRFLITYNDFKYDRVLCEKSVMEYYSSLHIVKFNYKSDFNFSLDEQLNIINVIVNSDFKSNEIHQIISK